MICLLQMHCAFISYTLIPLLPTQTSDQVEAARVWVPANEHVTSAPHLGHLATRSWLAHASVLFHLRVCQLFTSPPFLPSTLTWLSASPSLNLLPTSSCFFAFLPFHLFPHCPLSQGLQGAWILVHGCLCCSQQYSSSRHSKVHLLYLIFIFLGKPLTVRKLTLFLERVMFN